MRCCWENYPQQSRRQLKKDKRTEEYSWSLTKVLGSLHPPIPDLVEHYKLITLLRFLSSLTIKCPQFSFGKSSAKFWKAILSVLNLIRQVFLAPSNDRNQSSFR